MLKYALAKFAKEARSQTEHFGYDVIRIGTEDRPDVVATITTAGTINQATAAGYRDHVEVLHSLCDYCAKCVWDCMAIRHMEDSQAEWRDFGTLRDGDPIRTPGNLIMISMLSTNPVACQRWAIRKAKVDPADMELDQIFREFD